MENIELTSEEKREIINARGFYTEKLYSWKEYLFKLVFLITLVPHAIIMVYCLLLMAVLIITQLPYYITGNTLSMEFLESSGIYTTTPGIITALGILYVIWGITGGFIMTGKVFYTPNSYLLGGKRYRGNTLSYELIKSQLKKYAFIPLNKDTTERHFEMLQFMSTLGNHQDRNHGLSLLFILFLVGCIDYISIRYIIIDYIIQSGYTRFFSILFFGIGFFFILGIFSALFYRIFNPLYAFGNIGEKIQKLTPEIESQSRLIQLEFEKSQNFAILHSGFEKLSTTFSKIGELVLRLERVEKKANKGNLFDSVKYIDSLRTDIVTPLVELKRFLEGQKEELIISQKELTRVMVGESNELRGNRELATKRGEEVLRELDGNIGKLDIMITKIA